MEWKKGNFNRPLFLLFAVYIIALTWIILFKLTIPSNIDRLAVQRELNLIPFLDVSRNKFFNVFDMTANICVFIPFGVYTAALLKDVSIKSKVLTAFLLSLFYETVQFIFSIGVSDITDLMMNTLGAFIGIIIFKLISSKLVNEYKSRRFITLCSTAFIVPSCIVLGVASTVFNIV